MKVAIEDTQQIVKSGQNSYFAWGEGWEIINISLHVSMLLTRDSSYCVLMNRTKLTKKKKTYVVCK